MPKHSQAYIVRCGVGCRQETTPPYLAAQRFSRAAAWKSLGPHQALLVDAICCDQELQLDSKDSGQPKDHEHSYTM